MIRLTIASMVRPSPLQSDGSVAAVAVTPRLYRCCARATSPASATCVDRPRDQRRAGSAIVRMLALRASMLRAVHAAWGRESMLRRDVHEIHHKSVTDQSYDPCNAPGESRRRIAIAWVHCERGSEAIHFALAPWALLSAVLRHKRARCLLRRSGVRDGPNCYAS